jgi:hypothetical protein
MHRLKHAPVDHLPTYLRLTTAVSAYKTRFPAINMEDNRLLVQGEDTVHDDTHQEKDSETDSESESDADGDLDPDVEASAAKRGAGGASLEPCEPPLTKIPGGCSKKKGMIAGEAHRHCDNGLQAARAKFPTAHPAGAELVVARVDIILVPPRAIMCRVTSVASTLLCICKRDSGTVVSCTI